MKKSPLLKYILFSTTVFLLIVCFLRHDNVIRLVKARLDIRKQEKQIELYKGEISDLEEQIEAMSTNRDTLEKYAREKFRFAEPGDDVFIIPDSK